jgi:peptidoglycan DL-endopeptidase CwlO
VALLAARNHVGRHRAPGYNPLNEIADIATRSAQPAMKASAVAVASGGLVATFAIPASAAPSDEGSGAVAAGAGAPAAPAAPVTAAAPAVAVAAPAIDKAAAPNFGVVGFTAQAAAAKALAPVAITKIAPPAPAPAPAATTTRASRTTTRTATTTTTTTTATPKPTVTTPAPAPTGGIIGIAASLSGIPYVWGGTTTSGFDCSGFTSYVYRQVGKSLPRTAEAQRSASTKVSNPVPGDLIFFGYPAYHVGIYAGSGKMYDAPKPGQTTGLHVIWTQSNVSYGRF